MRVNSALANDGVKVIDTLENQRGAKNTSTPHKVQNAAEASRGTMMDGVTEVVEGGARWTTTDERTSETRQSQKASKFLELSTHDLLHDHFRSHCRLAPLEDEQLGYETSTKVCFDPGRAIRRRATETKALWAPVPVEDPGRGTDRALLRMVPISKRM